MAEKLVMPGSRTKQCVRGHITERSFELFLFDLFPVFAGAAMCDKRREISFAEEQFPGIDFSHIERGPDVVYDQHKVESEHAVMERGARFLQWLMARCAERTSCTID